MFGMDISVRPDREKCHAEIRYSEPEERHPWGNKFLIERLLQGQTFRKGLLTIRRSTLPP